VLSIEAVSFPPVAVSIFIARLSDGPLCPESIRDKCDSEIPMR
jgi:hypothetical protein